MTVTLDSLVVYVIEVTKIILNLFFLLLFFFLGKDFKCKKSTKRKTRNFYPLRSLCAQKIIAFFVFLFAYFYFSS